MMTEAQRTIKTELIWKDAGSTDSGLATLNVTVSEAPMFPNLSFA